MRAIHFALAAALLLPVAAGVPVEGALRVHGPMTISGSADHWLEAGAAFCNATAQASEFRLYAPVLLVTVSEEQLAYAQVGDVARPQRRTGFNEVSFQLDHANVTLAEGDHKGWLGADIGAPLSLEAPTRSVVTPNFGGYLGNRENPSSPLGSENSGSGFRHDFEGAHLDVDGWRRSSASGAMLLQFEGLDLEMRADQNTSTLKTGQEQAGELVGTYSHRWATLEAAEATWSADLGPGCMAGGPRGKVEWQGLASFQVVQGEVRSADEVLQPGRDLTRLEGRLAADLDALPSQEMDARITGDAQSTNLGATRVVAPASGGAGWWWLAIVGLVVTTAGSLTLWYHGRAGRPTTPSPEQCVALAETEAELGNYPEALRWIVLAREQSPKSERIRLDEAFFREMSGDEQGALELYDRLCAEMKGGEPDLLKARLLVRRGMTQEAGACLVAALGKTPALLLEMEGDDLLASVAGSGEVAQATAKAKRALGIE